MCNQSTRREIEDSLVCSPSRVQHISAELEAVWALNNFYLDTDYHVFGNSAHSIPQETTSEKRQVDATQCGSSVKCRGLSLRHSGLQLLFHNCNYSETKANNDY